MRGEGSTGRHPAAGTVALPLSALIAALDDTGVAGCRSAAAAQLVERTYQRVAAAVVARLPRRLLLVLLVAGLLVGVITPAQLGAWVHTAASWVFRAAHTLGG